MPRFEIDITRTAEKQLQSAARNDQERLATAILRLADQPRPRGCRKLSGFDDIFRIRVDRFRVIYSVSDARLVVLILKIGHRREVYR